LTDEKRICYVQDMNKPVVEVRGLSKQYHLGATVSHNMLRDAIADGFKSMFSRNSDLPRQSDEETIWALKDVSFDVKEGEVLGIIGRNGAGKSTLLKVLSRITEPTSGEARIKGRVGSLLEVGTGFHPELTGRENIFLNGAILGMKKEEIKRKFDEMVAFAEIEKFLDTPVKRYSSGMYVRLAFAVAAHFEPEILIVDEVLAVGDAQFQKRCLGKIGDVAKGGRTVLFVSHNMAAIGALCDRVMLLNEGMVIKDGGTHEVITQYLTEGAAHAASAVDLTDHPGRIRYLEKAFLSAWIENSVGVTGGVIKMGEAVTIALAFKCSRPVVAPGFGFIVEDVEGRRIFSVTNHMVPNPEMSRNVEQGVVRCRIPSLQLLAGTYYVTLALAESKTEYIDKVERALSFDVEEADVYGSGVIPEKSYGVVFSDTSFTYTPELEGARISAEKDN
jgi:lipopolysaccharide transport system ATP-binding protein